MLRSKSIRFMAVLLCMSALLLGAAPAAAFNINTDATTDDRSVTVPTAWWVYTGVDASYITNALSLNGARLTDIEIHSIANGTTYFTVRMVKNAGAYAVPGWWWYYGLTFSQVGDFLTANNGRLIDIEPYDAGGGTIRYAVIMVRNTGVAFRAWSYLIGVSSAEITQHINVTNGRLTDLDAYYVGSTKYYSAIFVANTGADAKTWQWWLNLSASEVTAKLQAFNGRIVDLDRLPNGLFNVIMVKNEGADSAAWWWRLDFSSATELIDFAFQLGARPIDIETYTVNGVRKYLGVFIDNSNAATRRIRGIFAQSLLDSSGLPTRGVFEAYLKRVSSSVLVDLNSAHPTEVASSIKVLHLLHAMKSVANGESLTSPFTYYDYPDSPFNANTKDACPISADEIAANKRTNYNLGQALTQMMSLSDNRTTRGVGLRYGFNAIRATADGAGLSNTHLATTLDHNNLGCAYYDPIDGRYGDPGNDTSAADLAKIYEGVWTSSLLSGSTRTAFLDTANPSSGASASLQTIINDEAAKVGKLGIASSFGSLMKSWGKGGSYGTCLGNPNCTQEVIVRSGAGLISLPVKVGGNTEYRTYAFGRLISDVPVSSFTAPEVTTYSNTYSTVANELYREEIRSALETW